MNDMNHMNHNHNQNESENQFQVELARIHSIMNVIKNIKQKEEYRIKSTYKLCLKYNEINERELNELNN